MPPISGNDHSQATQARQQHIHQSCPTLRHRRASSAPVAATAPTVVVPTLVAAAVSASIATPATVSATPAATVGATRAESQGQEAYWRVVQNAVSRTRRLHVHRALTKSTRRETQKRGKSHPHRKPRNRFHRQLLLIIQTTGCGGEGCLLPHSHMLTLARSSELSRLIISATPVAANCNRQASQILFHEIIDKRIDKRY
jgi:hypothetical protein